MPKKPKAKKSASKRLSARGGGYSWFVRISKITLPLVALGIMGLVFIRLSQDSQEIQLADLPTKENTKPGQIELKGARYEGMDAKGRKYTLTADKAIRNMLSDEAVLLENPRADVMLEGGNWVAVHAKNGDYDNKAGKLSLSGGVTVYHDSGYEMHLANIAVDMETRHAVTTEPVTAQGPAGELKAQNMDVVNEGELVVFGGPVFLTLYGMKAKPPKKVRG
ncbi:MAG TPA: LPS export ABC transporter periplasmic protein LptC [Patescibacteria group bacterium]|nr:LPS export ABC transporter periplasmic protein LptC [Patescibacteria group bacterium]